jgi:PKHD-type hydroxylase
MDIPLTWQFKTDHIENWAYLNNLFTPEECSKIIEIGNKKLKKATAENDPLRAVRESEIAWLFYSEELEFVFRRVTDAVLNLNEQFFKFDLFGIAEGFQFTRYDAPTGHYGLHIDRTLNGPVRKLSLTIQLSSPEDYEGGDLVLQLSKDPDLMSKELGKMIVFPSYVLHEVRPVTKGTRYSLVAWITGKPFK